MPGYTLRQLEYFAAVAETRSISSAAAALHVTPTAVASALNELERVLRTQLMVRRKAHGVTLTPTGRYLHERVTTLLREADELELATASGGTELAGPLVLGCFSSVAPIVVPPLMQWLRHRHPGVDLTVVTGSWTELPQRLLAGGLDLVIGYDITLPAGLDFVPLYSARPYAILPQGHPLTRHDEVSLADLAREPMILVDLPPAAQHTLRCFEEAGVTPRIDQRITDFELARSLVGRGFGYSILIQRPTVNRSYEGLPIVPLEITSPALAGNVLMMWPHDMRLTDRAAALVGFAIEHADELDPQNRASLTASSPLSQG